MMERSDVETTDGAPQGGAIETTDGAPEGGAVETTDGKRGGVRTTLEIRRKIAVLNATCPRCGVTQARKTYIKRTKTDGKILRLKCSACGHTWKICVE